MPRVLDADRNVLEVEDKISGDILELYYDMPSNALRTAYANAYIERRGKKIVAKKNTLGIQASFGLQIISGFKKGAFGFGGKLIASDATDPDYYADWKTVVAKGAPDVLAYLARTVFGAVDAPGGSVLFEDEVEDLEKPGEFLIEDDTPTTPAAGEVEATGDPLSAQ